MRSVYSCIELECDEVFSVSSRHKQFLGHTLTIQTGFLATVMFIRPLIVLYLRFGLGKSTRGQTECASIDDLVRCAQLVVAIKTFCI